MQQQYTLVHIQNPNIDQLDISDMFKSDYDYDINRKEYEEKDPLHIYQHIRELYSGVNPSLKFPTITLASDATVSLSTISGACEAHMDMREEGDKIIVDGDIHVIYIDTSPDIQTNHVENHNQLAEQIISNAMGINEMSYCRHRVNMAAKNIHYIGLNEEMLTEFDKDILNSYQIENYSLQLLRKKGIRKIMEILIKRLQNEKLYIVLDMCAIDSKCAPSVYRYHMAGSDDGFNIDELKELFDCLKQHPSIRGIDITGFHFGLKKDSTKNMIANKLTMICIENILHHFVHLKSRSINIFNENSKFLIWRRLDDDDPIGWKILRGLSLEEREKIIDSIGDDNVINQTIDDYEFGETYDALITTTTIEEQQQKSYYVAINYLDFCLTPNEKVNMIFELLNTVDSFTK